MTRKTAIAFRIVQAPSFARCFACGGALAGRRAWAWKERNGSTGYGCARVCMFPEHALTGATEAA